MDELIPGVIADAVDAATVTEVAWQMAYGEGVTYEDMLAARREILLGVGMTVARDVAAAERERIRQGLAPLEEYNGIRPGDRVVYENPVWRRTDGTYATGGLDGELVVTEIYRFPGHGQSGSYVSAILDGGQHETNADHLRMVLRPRDCPDAGKCHHDCGEARPCFRVLACGPLSGTYPGDRWPPEVLACEQAKKA